MRRRARPVALLLLLALLAAGALVLVRERESARDLVAPPTTPAARPASSAAPSADAPASEASTRAPAEADLARVVLGANAEPAHGAARVRGRLLREGGEPARGAVLSLRGWESIDARTDLRGQLEVWEGRTARAGDDGRFEIAFEPPAGYQFGLEAALPEHARASWRWRWIEPARVIDLGDVMLRRAGAIVGRVVDASGAPLLLDWSVRAQSGEAPVDPSRDAAYASAKSDPITGEFRLEGLPPGPTRVEAQAGSLAEVGPVVAHVVAGEETRVLLRHDGPDPSRSIVVRATCERFPLLAYSLDAIVLRRDGLEVARIRPGDAPTTRGRFDDVAPGTYEVAIEDPRFVRWSVDGVEPGAQLRAELVGNAALALHVVDAASGVAIERYALDVQPEASGYVLARLPAQPWKTADAAPPPDGVYAGWIPGDSDLVVKAEGYAPARVRVDGLAPREQRALTVALERGCSLSATVVHADGSAVTDVRVELHAGELDATLLDDPRRWQMARRESGGARAETSDAAGHVRFASVARGRWTVLADLGGRVRAHAAVDVAGVDPPTTELRLPPFASLRGIVRGAPRSFRHMQLVARSDVEGDPPWARFFSTPGTTCALDERGAFRVGPLAPGEWVVRLDLPEVSAPDVLGSNWTQPGGRIELERITIAGGEDLVRDYDLGASAPGSLRVDVTVDGAAAEGVAVLLHEVPEDGAARKDPAIAGVTIAGAADLPCVLPARYRVVVRGTEGWLWCAPDAITVEPGRETRTSAAIERARGRLRMRVIGTGDPLARTHVLWTSTVAGFELRGRVRTDANGVADTELACGAYRFSTTTSPDDEGALVDWTPTGPTPPVIELPLRR